MDVIHGTLTTWWQRRVYRVGRHIITPWKDPFIRGLVRHPHGWILAALHYTIELPLLILDVFGFPEGFGWLQSIFKPYARSLDPMEIQTAQSLFQDQVDLKKVKIDENSKLGTYRGKYAYVGYYYINSSSRLSLPVLMHELVHIFQYEQVGSPYIFRNLIAHWSKHKYNYGGLTRLKQILKDPETVHQFNFEQRADIVSDYVLITSGQKPEWGYADSTDSHIYLEVIQLLMNPRV